MRVESVMHGGDQVPVVQPATCMPDVIHEMSSKRLGMTCVADERRRLVGLVTDGDLRRHQSPTANLLGLTASDVMTHRPVTVERSLLAVEALKIMEERKITSLVVVDADGVIDGVVHLHDLWRTQMF
jgi:arabinose-5-phosphate isomerase